MKQIRTRFTYANVMSSIAVFLVLGGATAIAVTKVPNKSVGTKQLKANAITTAKIKKSSVTTTKLKDGSVVTNKLANNAVTGAKLADGSVSSAKISGEITAAFANRPSRYANISSGGTILAQSQGIAQANVVKDGNFYCLSGLSPAPVGGQVTIDYNESGTKVAAQFGLGEGPGCPGGTQAFVSPRLSDTGSTTEAGFFLVVY